MRESIQSLLFASVSTQAVAIILSVDPASTATVVPFVIPRVTLAVTPTRCALHVLSTAVTSVGPHVGYLGPTPTTVPRTLVQVDSSVVGHAPGRLTLVAGVYLVTILAVLLTRPYPQGSVMERGA